MRQITSTLAMSVSPWLADPSLVDRMLNQGVLSANEGQFKEALFLFNKAVKANPKSALTYYNRARSHLEHKDYRRAIADYNKCINLDPSFTNAFNANAFNNRGVAFAATGQHDRAIADYTEALRLDPNHAAAFNNRGNAFAETGQHDRAIADCTEALRLKAPALSEFYNRGVAFSEKSQRDRAMADFTEALRLEAALLAFHDLRGGFSARVHHSLAIADLSDVLRIDSIADRLVFGHISSYIKNIMPPPQERDALDRLKHLETKTVKEAVDQRASVGTGVLDPDMESAAPLIDPMQLLLIQRNIPKEKWQETAAEFERLIAKVLAPEVRPLWNDRKKKPELAHLAQMTAPEFLRTVWADQIIDGVVITEDIRKKDSSLMESVGEYLSNRKRRNKRPDGSIDYGLAEGLRFVTRPTGPQADRGYSVKKKL